MDMQKDNYKNVCEYWRLKTLETDFRERYVALGLPGYNDNNLPITYFGVDYEINRSDAKIHSIEKPEEELDFCTQSAIYHLFYFSKKAPRNSNNFIPLHELRGAAPFSPAFKKSTLNPFAKTFEGKTLQLIETGEKLGFERLSNSDAGFQAMAFTCMPIQFLFWDGDDELPAQATILFDEKITDFTHEETVIGIGSDLVNRLIDAAGLERLA
ncbi:MAG: hypothetical protein PWP56_2592 [Acetobacterium sp.]|nr:hypothetical protein [Acetobacterium sp.]